MCQEEHYYIWLIIGNDIWYAGTYGGVYELSFKKFDRKDYMTLFEEAMNEDLYKYYIIFDFEPEVKKKIKFEELLIEKQINLKSEVKLVIFWIC